jgi:hypothetical protein
MHPLRIYIGNGALVDQALNVTSPVPPLPGENITIFNILSPSSSVVTRTVMLNVSVISYSQSSDAVLNSSKICSTILQVFTLQLVYLVVSSTE